MWCYLEKLKIFSIYCYWTLLFSPISLVMSQYAENERVLKVEKWLKEVLDSDEVPNYEVNDGTLTILEDMMKQHNESVAHHNILKQQMVQETSEYIAEKEVTHMVLSSVDMEPGQGLSPHSTKYLKSYCAAAEVLETVLPTPVPMVVATTELEDELNRSQSRCAAAEEMIQLLYDDLNETKELKTHLERQFTELEDKLHLEQKNVETLKKSMKFHAQKKKDYDKKIIESGEKLKAVGFSTDLSHDAIVKLGRQLDDIEANIKPHQMHLDSYRSLPADLNLARLKLRDKLEELKMIEEEIRVVFENISLS